MGATKRQIHSSVLYEALVLAAVGIPAGLMIGCTGIGITLYCLRDALTGYFYGATAQLRLVLHPLALLIAVSVCLVTTLISAAIPARRAIRIAPIQSIRQTDDVKLKTRDVRVSGLTGKLFGFEGMMAAKNFKRNRKCYRSTVLSLFLSVTLFISASSFCAYLTDAVERAAGTKDAIDIHYSTVGARKADPEEVLTLLSGVDGVKEGVYYDSEGFSFCIPPEYIDPESGKYIARSENGECYEPYGYLIFLQDEAFRELCKVNEISPEPFFGPDAPQALIWNQVSYWSEDQTGKLSRGICRVLDPDSLPCVVRIEETAYGDQEFGEDRNQINQGEMLREYCAGAEIKERIFGLESGFALVYPYSMMSAVMEGEEGLYATGFYFQVEHHAQAFTDMKARLVEAGMDTSRLYDRAADEESRRMLVLVVNVFAYGFIILISLIAAANVFNTISTNILLRSREIAMLQSIGLGQGSLRRMMNYECLIYGGKGLMWGLPAAMGMTFVIWRIADLGDGRGFYIPWYSIVIALGSVFLVVFATMFYSMAKIRKQNLLDLLKNENL